MVIETHRLTKSIRGQVVIDGVDLAVPQGSIFGLFGANGSGKSSLIRLLTGQMTPTAGRCEVFGMNPSQSKRALRKRVAVLEETPSIRPHLSGRRNLKHNDLRTGPDTKSDIDRGLDAVGLLHVSTKRAGLYSTGMQRRLAVAAMFLHRHQLLVLDEPTTGLDPRMQQRLHELIRDAQRGGATIFFTTRMLSDIELVCTHAAVIKGGALAAQGPLHKFRGGKTQLVRIRTPDLQQAHEVLVRMTSAGNVSVAHDSGHLDVSIASVPVEQLVNALVQAHIRVTGVEDVRVGLDDRFLALAGATVDVAE